MPEHAGATSAVVSSAEEEEQSLHLSKSCCSELYFTADKNISYIWPTQICTVSMAGRGVDLTLPAWMTTAAAQQTSVPGSQQPGSTALALVEQPANQDLYDLSDYDSSDSENQDDFLPPGPLEAEKCTLSGPGFTGGAAGSPVSFVITAKDGRGKRIREGGAYVRVQMKAMRGVVAEDVDPVIKDHGDGSYTVTYSVSTRGNYEVFTLTCSFPF